MKVNHTRVSIVQDKFGNSDIEGYPDKNINISTGR